MCTTLGLGKNNMRHHTPWVRQDNFKCSPCAEWSGIFHYLHVNEGWQLSDFSDFLGRQGTIKACVHFPQLVEGKSHSLIVGVSPANRFEDSDFGPVSKAILAKREAELRELISLGYDLGEQDRFGWTPLHLSVYWPLGMEILLAAGVQANGRFLGYSRDWVKGQITPLEYAIQDRQDEAILLLLDTDVMMNPRYHLKANSSPPEIVELLLHRHVLAEVMRYHYQPSSRIFAATIEAMVQRSNRLGNLARAHLSPHELDRLCISYEDEPIQILDAYAAGTAEALKNVGVKLPEALEPGLVGSTVYHILVYEFFMYDWSKELWTEFGDRLWSSGFHDTNTYDRDGLTPLHQACLTSELDMVNWLMSHGGDPTTVIRGHSLNALHLLSTGFKYQINEDMVGPYRDALARMAGICGVSCRDHCRCACSPPGCTPTAILFRAATKTWCEKKDFFSLRCRSADLSPDAVETSCLEFARVETFDRLGISHVCCEIDLYKFVADMPQDIIEEIQDEESELIDQLESWMSLYEEERAKFEGSAVQFLGKWSDMLKDKLDVPAPFEEHWRRHIKNGWCVGMPNYFAKPSHVEHGHGEMDEDHECTSEDEEWTSEDQEQACISKS